MRRRNAVIRWETVAWAKPGLTPTGRDRERHRTHVVGPELELLPGVPEPDGPGHGRVAVVFTDSVTAEPENTPVDEADVPVAPTVELLEVDGEPAPASRRDRGRPLLAREIAQDDDSGVLAGERGCLRDSAAERSRRIRRTESVQRSWAAVGVPRGVPPRHRWSS